MEFPIVLLIKATLLIMAAVPGGLTPAYCFSVTTPSLDFWAPKFSVRFHLRTFEHAVPASGNALFIKPTLIKPIHSLMTSLAPVYQAEGYTAVNIYLFLAALGLCCCMQALQRTEATR